MPTVLTHARGCGDEEDPRIVGENSRGTLRQGARLCACALHSYCSARSVSSRQKRLLCKSLAVEVTVLSVNRSHANNVGQRNVLVRVHANNRRILSKDVHCSWVWPPRLFDSNLSEKELGGLDKLDDTREEILDLDPTASISDYFGWNWRRISMGV
jgi:hypothetical protein